MVPQFRILLILSLILTGAAMIAPEPQQAMAFDADDDDGYWNNYWRWYDNDYRSHYNRRHRTHRDYDNDYYGTRYSPYSNYNYDSGYRSPSRYYDYYDRYDGYDRYNRYDRYYDRHGYRGRNTIDLGDFRFQWR